jgi:hypothetical protein
MALGKVYCFGPTFRAEKSKTRRHLTEFWMVEPEMAYADLDDVIELAEGLVDRSVVGRVLDRRRRELQVLERDTAPLERVTAPFPRLRYDEAARAARAEGACPSSTGPISAAPTRRCSRSTSTGPSASRTTRLRRQGVLHEARPGAARQGALRRRARAGRLRRDHRRRPAHRRPGLLEQRIREHDLPRRRSSGISTCAGTAPSRTAASAWASSVAYRGSAGSSTCGRRFRIRECCIGCIREELQNSPGMGSCRIDEVANAEWILTLCTLHSTEMLNSPHEDRPDLPRLPQEPRRLRGDARARPQAGPRTDPRPGRRRRARRQHVRVHRQGEAGVDRRHPRDGGAQEDRRLPPLVVTGCLAERYRDELRAQIPEIDAVLGTGEVPALSKPSRCRGPAAGCAGVARARSTHSAATGERRGPVTAPPASSRHGTRAQAAADLLYDADTPRLLATPRHYAYVKIAEGCDYKCAFCIIPTLRGRYRSRPPTRSCARPSRWRRAAQGAAARLAGHELLRHRSRRAWRARTVAAPADAIDGLEWIRMLYLYPTTIGDDVLARWRTVRRCAATSTCRCSTHPTRC